MRSRPLFILAGLVLAASLHGEASREAVLPPQTPGLVYLEAEDAVSTNFSSEATLDYASSGLRVLQLNQPPQAPGAPFFAEYAFLVEQAGEYELWLGGTPPGPADALSPSYISPFQYRLDQGPAVTVYREQVQVVANYSVTNYWYALKAKLKLSAGTHILRLELSERRRYDSRYFFQLDALFLLAANAQIADGAALPPLFPRQRADRSLDNPYRSLAEYETIVQQQSKNLDSYLVFAKVYSLLGDYANALKVLNRARLGLGDDPGVLFLMAKNRIWGGEADEGIRLYREYLKLKPEDQAVWAEAAKVSAWLGRYAESLALYQQARALFPDDLNLLVNQGLTQLWASQVDAGKLLLEQAWDQVKADAGQIKVLSGIYQVNGYPKESLEVLERGTQALPGQIELELALQEALLRQGQSAKAREFAERIKSIYRDSPALNAILATVELKASLKDATLESYRKRLAAKPDDLKLRNELVKAYFWNGKRQEAIAGSLDSLVNQLFRAMQDMDRELEPLYASLDTGYASLRSLGPQAQALRAGRDRLAKSLEQAKASAQRLAELEKSGKTPDKLPELQDAATVAQAALLENLAAQQALIDQAKAELARDAGLVAAAQAAAAQSRKDQATLDGRKPWSWDRSGSLAELQAASSRSNSLADWLIARIGLAEQQFGPARLAAARLGAQEGEPPAFERLRKQLEAWAPPSAAVPVATGAPGGAGSSPDPAKALEQAEQALVDSLNLAAALDAAQPALKTALGQFHAGLQSRLGLLFLQFDTDTWEQRAQLGEYYLTVGQYGSARRQLERVLLVVPGNIGARFSLARAKQLAGDWSGAMALYREVWESDPKYENTASLYNQLAKAHATQLSSSVNGFWDNGRNTNRFRLELQSQGSTDIGFNAAYTQDTVSIIRTMGLTDPVTINLHNLELGLPVNIPDTGLTVTPRLGGTLKNNYPSDYFPSDSVPPLAGFFEHFVVAPQAGLDLAFSANPLKLNLSYSFDQIPDSFLPMRTTSYEHRAELSANLFLEPPNPGFFRSAGSRTLLKASSVFSPFDPATNQNYAGLPPQTNFLYSAVEDLSFNFLLAPAPWTIMVLNASVAWEDATVPSETAYYAPNKVLTARGGLQFASWIGLADHWVLGLSLRALAGLNSTPSNGSDPNVLVLDGGLRVELSKADLAFFLDGSASRASWQAEERYWAVNLLLGVRLAVPDYLIP